MSGLFVSQSFSFQVWPNLSKTKHLPIFLKSFCTRSCFFPLLLGRFFFACPLSPPWNLPSFTVESTFSSPRSRFDPRGSRLPGLFFISRSGQIILFGKGGSAILANCSLCGTKATLSFSAGPVCSSFSAEACAILQALPAAPTSLPFLFLILALFSPPCFFYLSFSGTNYFLPHLL